MLLWWQNDSWVLGSTPQNAEIQTACQEQDHLLMKSRFTSAAALRGYRERSIHHSRAERKHRPLLAGSSVGWDVVGVTCTEWKSSRFRQCFGNICSCSNLLELRGSDHPPQSVLLALLTFIPVQRSASVCPSETNTRAWAESTVTSSCLSPDSSEITWRCCLLLRCLSWDCMIHLHTFTEW